MRSTAKTPQEYIDNLPEGRKEVMIKLRKVILDNLPVGFEEMMSYGMIGYVVPHSLYPAGYHCDPKLPLPFLNMAWQKNYLAIYHMGLYADKQLMDWFLGEYPKHVAANPDMGKSCVRFKKAEYLPFQLIGQLAKKMTVDHWIKRYEKEVRANT
ncbi:MAG: DUF1801 domain-containing protein [Cyclobacteriaceae bacterium]|nr:DUF1801 domain-containing protein [Cyclobacteriaceae bacterium]MDH5599501.1 DUF1801 domain-containing protein [Cyclobacteriaceae bacterium]